MKSGAKKLLAVVLLVAFVLGIAGCANTLLGEGGPAPADQMYGVWAPSGSSSDASTKYVLAANGNGSHGSSTFTWRVDPEAKDPQKLIMVDPSGKATVKAFEYDHDSDKLTIYEGESSSGSKTTYTRDVKDSSPSNATLPEFAYPEGH